MSKSAFRLALPINILHNELVGLTWHRKCRAMESEPSNRDALPDLMESSSFS
jgi:hypothetical protein